ncbi:protein jagged-1-like isoform X2 [Hemicordylus capensis]|uniref:protein jagged-1-like isoform X2 n=1 Tax=Hemicordylus capensis TaxID=884348 RepID=UPI0023023FEE|nr:protein jagged-1-like isoform X2 [Hemicordylus capensis]
MMSGGRAGGQAAAPPLDTSRALAAAQCQERLLPPPPPDRASALLCAPRGGEPRRPLAGAGQGNRRGQAAADATEQGPPLSGCQPASMRLRSPGVVCALLLLLHLRPQVPEAVGIFELQIRAVRNEKGVLADGRCCRGGGLDPPCPVGEQCRTFFRACLKEYQLRALPGGPCVLGAATTPVLGGNVFSANHQKGPDHASRMVVPFDFAWPRSYSLVLEAWDAANTTDVTSQGSGQLMERVTRPGMLNPGEGWQDLKHHGRGTSLEYRVRVRCQEHYYGPACTLFCRPRDDFFGHHICDAAGNKVCLDGWTGDKCMRALCRQGCHEMHGFCEVPGECRCHYGWMGLLCDKCILFPGCVHGSCTEPWQCNCETNWGGLLCDKDLNYCGSHRPCRNGGTCANKEPDQYECICPEGYHGRNCENATLLSPVAEFTCTSEPCSNGGTCLKTPSGFRCVCPPGWNGESCQNEVTDCLSGPCSHGGSCRDLPSGFKCICPPQWTGKTCQIDVNECQRKPCLHARGCKNLIGSYFCDCLEGWTGPNCNISKNPCQGRCHNGGTCQVQGGRRTCFCPAGYTGTECETELSSCISTPCLHGGQCQEMGHKSFRCSCPPGLSGPHCEVLVDLCSPNPCPEGASCLDGGGSYVCSCPEGAACQKLQDPCLEGECQGGAGSLLLYTALPLALLLVLVAPLLALLALRMRRRPREAPPLPAEPAANNSLQPDAVHLICNINRRDAEPGPRGGSLAAKAGQPPPASYPTGGLPKTDISNEERAKLNRLNAARSLPRPSL